MLLSSIDETLQVETKLSIAFAKSASAKAITSSYLVTE
jgi:hypothetical protein